MSFDEYDEVFTKELAAFGLPASPDPEKWKAEYATCVSESKKWIAPIFDPNTSRTNLPTRAEYLTINKSRSVTMLHVFREIYTHHSYLALTDELLTAIARLVREMKFSRIVELGAGAGWLTFWLQKYGVPAYALDSGSWEHRFDEKLPLVNKGDGVTFTRKADGVELFILSWPPMTPFAAEVWKAMKPGQYLLYFGERGGCNADDEFFNLTDSSEIEDQWGLDEGNLAFWSVHDRPILFRKTESEGEPDNVQTGE